MDKPSLIDDLVRRYIQLLRDNGVPVWRIYLFGSYASGKAHEQSDIDLAVFLDVDQIDGFNTEIELMRWTRTVDLRIEPHCFSRKDFENPDPFVQQIIAKGERIV